ncbi:MAG: multicopper oxidase domain-containing protein [Phycisphaerae bacterium]|nr:multicopper oxidase domain-containing protein [Phycisphaerae bacterium]
MTSPPAPGGGKLDSSFEPTLDLRLRARGTDTQIFEGATTRTLGYEPELITGDPTRVTSIAGSYLGPIIRARTGDRLRIRLQNDLNEPTIIHWHGLRVPAIQDGHPSTAVGSGGEFVYEFEVRDRAGTYWFHPHAHGTTASQVYRGLAGLLLVSDDEEASAGLPTGDNDIPLIIQDRSFGGDNQLVYPPHSGEMMDGFLGDQVLVNGRPSFRLSVATQVYRLRLVNGSNSRTYKLAWSDGTSLIVIATDGGLLEAPIERQYVTLGPGERVELWADFSGRSVGTELSLKSLPFSGADIGMDSMIPQGPHHGRPGGTKFPAETEQAVLGRSSGEPLTVMTVDVSRSLPETLSRPAALSNLASYRIEDAINADSPRQFAVTVGMAMGSSGMGMRWGFDGRQFSETNVALDEIIPFNKLEVWEFVNQTSPMAMNHPIHVHGTQFRVIERNVAAGYASGWESVREGYVDEGWKDTVLLMPGERVRLLIRFQDFAGTYVYHCHNLEHSDGGMMRNLSIR